VLIVGVVLGLLLGLWAGGSIGNLATIRLRWIPLLFAAVVVLSLLGVLLFNAVAFAERIALPWSRVATDVAE